MTEHYDFILGYVGLETVDGRVLTDENVDGVVGFPLPVAAATADPSSPRKIAAKIMGITVQRSGRYAQVIAAVEFLESVPDDVVLVPEVQGERMVGAVFLPKDQWPWPGYPSGMLIRSGAQPGASSSLPERVDRIERVLLRLVDERDLANRGWYDASGDYIRGGGVRQIIREEFGTGADPPGGPRDGGRSRRATAVTEPASATPQADKILAAIDAWAPSEDHTGMCVGHEEGQGCCLDADHPHRETLRRIIAHALWEA